MSTPWLKFYPADWRADPALRMCSLAARGLWMEMLCVMHEATPRGHLLVNGRPITDDQLASLVGMTADEVSPLLSELEDAGVFSRKRNGVVYSRRMERDEIKARKNRDNGKMGGNPSLCKDREIDQSVNPLVKAQKPEARYQIPEEENRRDARTASQPAPRAANSRGSTLPGDWSPKPSHYDLARQYGLDAAWVDRKADAMRDWAIGNRNRAVARKADWDRTFTGWLRRDAEQAASRKTQIIPFAKHQERRNGHAISDALAELHAIAEAAEHGGFPPTGRGFGH